MSEAQSLLDNLNQAQRAAAAHFEGPALVIAGAGAGKTRTVVHRIAHLLEAHGVYPTEVLAVTFTNKAASEMKHRVKDLIGPQADQLWVSTFHSAGVRILRGYGERIGLKPGFVIYDDNDQLDVLKTILESIPGAMDTNPRYLRSIIDRAKSNLWTPDDLLREGEDWIAGLPKDVAVDGYRRYQNALARANAIDFGDLLVRVVQLFQAAPDVLDKVQQRAVFIHVDEYQDTNRAQYVLTNMLADKYQNLLVVGDPDQSIYSFRAADIRNILDFQNDYPLARTYRLEENYRSNANILGVANKLIETNTERLEKTLLAVKPPTEPVRIYRAPDHRAEADFVAMRVEAMRGQETSLKDIAVLYRTNAQSRALEDRFLRSQIPTRIVGGVSFYDRQEIKDLLSFARLAINPNDDVSVKRAIKRPRRGIGDASLEKLEAWANANKVPLFAAFARADEVLERGGKNAETFHKLMTELGEYATEHTAAEFLKLAIDATGYAEMLQSEMKTGNKYEVEGRLENLQELVNAASDWDKENHGTIESFLDDAALLSSVDDARLKVENKQNDDEAVTFMTMHNAKGLEFKHVFIVGLEEGLLPHKSSIVEAGGIEEERRLFYVGITRAMEQLTMTFADSRQVFGKTLPSQPSRFLEDIPADMLVPVNLYNQAQGEAGVVVRNPAPHVRPVATATDITGIKGGETVQHPKFGKGKVLAITGQGDRQEAMIAFGGDVGTKKLLIKYANLTMGQA